MIFTSMKPLDVALAFEWLALSVSMKTNASFSRVVTVDGVEITIHLDAMSVSAHLVTRVKIVS